MAVLTEPRRATEEEIQVEGHPGGAASERQLKVKGRR